MTLGELLKKYPMPEGWGQPEEYCGHTRVGDVSFELAGLAATNRHGTQVTGSAAELGVPAVTRAFFELIERVSVVHAIGGESPRLAVYDEMHRQVGLVDRPTVFPQSSVADQWRYSVSNGVALHRSWPEACRRAVLELEERDRLIRSWFGQIAPRLLSLDLPTSAVSLSQIYELRAYAFCQPGDDVRVAGVFGFPDSPTVPLIYGFGAGMSEADALAHAIRECCQRMAFLWGEELPNELPPLAPTADYHQDFFLCPAMRSRIEAWLDGAHRALDGLLPNAGPRVAATCVDLTPESVAGDLFVAKALHPGLLPLTFGRGYPLLSAEIPEEFQVHPFC